jgi:hypothetical protein
MKGTALLDRMPSSPSPCHSTYISSKILHQNAAQSYPASPHTHQEHANTTVSHQSFSRTTQMHIPTQTHAPQPPLQHLECMATIYYQYPPTPNPTICAPQTANIAQRGPQHSLALHQVQGAAQDAAGWLVCCLQSHNLLLAAAGTCEVC